MNYNITGMDNLSGFLLITTFAVVGTIKFLIDLNHNKKNRQSKSPDFDQVISRERALADIDHRREQTRHLRLKNDKMQSKAEKKIR